MSEADQLVSGYAAPRGSDEGARIQPGGDVGFDAPLAGFGTDAGFEALDNRSYFWTSTEDSPDEVFRRRIEAASPMLYRFTNPPSDFMISVRCVVD